MKQLGAGYMKQGYTRTIKGFVLGSSAVLAVSVASVSGAQAADLPVKAKAVEYVKVCSLYGAGFYYIPGSDTCIKLGGYLRADMGVNTNAVFTGDTGSPGSLGNRFSDAFVWRSRSDLNIDTRTATEYGTLRTYADVVFTWTSDNYAGGAAAGSTVYSPIGTVQAPQNANQGAVSAGTLGVYYTFIQFAGFTIGKAVSSFDAPWTAYPGNMYDSLVGGSSAVTGVNQFTYTAEFGQGVTASVSAQDPTAYTQAGIFNVGTGTTAGGLGAFGTSDFAGTNIPDIIGNVQVDQAWGLFKASLVAHDNHAAYYNGLETGGHPDDKFGWAGQLALSINNLPTGPGDVINVSGVYTDGATRYDIPNLAAMTGAATVYGGTSLPGAYQSVGFGMAPDSVFGAAGEQHLIQTWGGRGGYTHNWNPYWNSAIYGAYASIHYDGGAKALICGNGVTGGSFQAYYGAGVTSCNPDYSIAQLGTVTRWTPVKNLTFAGEFVYTHLDQNMSGEVAMPASTTTGKPGALYQLKDQNTFQLLLRAQRNW
jgi:hypothetical protein